MGRTEEAIIAHLDQALGQDVLQETRDELVGGQRAELGLAGIGCITVRDLVVLHLDDAAVAEGNAKDVRGEILERGAQRAIANGLAVNDPALLPHIRGNVRKAIGLAQDVAHLGAHELREGLDGEQEILAGGLPRVSVFG